MSTEQKQEVVLSPKAKLINEVSARLGHLLTEQIQAMPRGFNDTRFLQNCLSVLRDTKDIEKCTPMSIARCMIKGAYLGLDFFRKECYAIPYGDQLNFQTDYKGEIKLCKQYSKNPIQDIYAKLVREGDQFELYVENGKQILNFKPLPFNEGKIIGAFAVVYYENGSMIAEAMSPKEIEDIRNKYSKAPNSPAWQKSAGEMYKKVVLRRLTKMIDLNFDRSEQDEAFEEGADPTMDPKKQIIDVSIDDPFKEAAQEEAAPAQAVPPAATDPDEQIKEVIRKEHPDWNEWQVSDEVEKRKQRTSK